MNHYTYLITNLNPTDEKQFYVGARSCDCLPTKDLDYMGSSSPLTKDIKRRGLDNYQKIILREFDSREEADIHERAVHQEYDVAQNPEFYNRKIGVVGFHVTEKSLARQKLTMNSSNWKATIGKEMLRKRKDTVNNPQWKATIGKEGRRKFKETVYNSGWKATTGKEQSRKHKETINTPHWKETVGKQQTEKRLLTIGTPEWQQKHTFICPHCDKSIQNKANFNRWHNNNCKMKIHKYNIT